MAQTEYDMSDIKPPKTETRGRPSHATNEEAISAGFEGAHFPGFIKQNLKYNNHGDLEFTILIPFRYVDSGTVLAKGFGRPLEFFVVPITKPTEEEDDSD